MLCGDICHFLTIGGTKVKVGQMSYFIIGGTNVGVGQMSGGTNVGGTNVGNVETNQDPPRLQFSLSAIINPGEQE
jgi:hypothetical protein